MNPINTYNYQRRNKMKRQKVKGTVSLRIYIHPELWKKLQKDSDKNFQYPTQAILKILDSYYRKKK